MSRVVSDRVLSLSRPAVRKARVLVTDDNNVAVFTTPQGPPTTTFRVSSISSRSFTTTDGDTITFRAVGSSCSWPLARCRVSTAQLLSRWTSA